MVEQAIGAVQGPATTRVNPVTLSLASITTGAAESAYAKFGTVTTAERSTLEGFSYIDSGYGDGFNMLTANLDVRAEGNGLLNRHGKYNEDGSAPMCSFMTMA